MLAAGTIITASWFRQLDARSSLPNKKLGTCLWTLTGPGRPSRHHQEYLISTYIRTFHAVPSKRIVSRFWRLGKRNNSRTKHFSILLACGLGRSSDGAHRGECVRLVLFVHLVTWCAAFEVQDEKVLRGLLQWAPKQHKQSAGFSFWLLLLVRFFLCADARRRPSEDAPLNMKSTPYSYSKPLNLPSAAPLLTMLKVPWLSSHSLWAGIQTRLAFWEVCFIWSCVIHWSCFFTLTCVPGLVPTSSNDWGKVIFRRNTSENTTYAICFVVRL